MSADLLLPIQAKPSHRGWSIGVGQTAILFGAAALLLFAVTHGVIPTLTKHTTIEPVLLWFGAAGLGVFLPLLLMAVVLLRQEGVYLNADAWRGRLRFRRMDRADWLWAFGGTLAVAVLAAKTMLLMKLLFGYISVQPSFLFFEPLTPDRYWILAVWLPFCRDKRPPLAGGRGSPTAWGGWASTWHSGRRCCSCCGRQRSSSHTLFSIEGTRGSVSRFTAPSTVAASWQSPSDCFEGEFSLGPELAFYKTARWRRFRAWYIATPPALRCLAKQCLVLMAARRIRYPWSGSKS
jgi:hypothetical protein